jgi:hypothetical protein
MHPVKLFACNLDCGTGDCLHDGYSEEQMKLLFQSAVLAASLSIATAQGTSEAITFGSYDVSSFITGTGGWTFSPTANISITALGCFTNIIALNGSVSIGLWDDTGTLLGSNFITSASTRLNQSFYSSLAPIFLTSGHLYTIGVYSASGGISLGAVGPAAGGTADMSPEITLGGYAVGNGGFVFPTAVQGGNGAMLLGANFQYTGAVPEPSTAALALLGGLAFSAFRRQKPS